MKTLIRTIAILTFLTISLLNTKAIANEDTEKADTLAEPQIKEAPKEEEPIKPLKLICKLMPQMCI